MWSRPDKIGDDVVVMPTISEALSRCLALDLEVAGDGGRIYAFAGVRADTDQSVVWAKNARSTALDNENLVVTEGDEVVEKRRVDSADQALRESRRPVRRCRVCPRPQSDRSSIYRSCETADPGLRLLQLPALDTLWINPLAFPRNPYHRLVKHYKDAPLTRSERNDPYLDARLALQLFCDQREALHEVPPETLAAWHWLTTRGPQSAGFDLFFAALRGSQSPSASGAREAIRSRLDDHACQTQLRRAIADAPEHGWVLAFAMAWISVSGGTSVMPPWVRHQFPGASRLVRSLRDNACNDERCAWCRTRHNSLQELKRWFGFDSFREEPADPESDQSLQQRIVEAAMAGQDALAILPTGTGKSLCYQLPALSRYDKTGALTVVISPLVALMADQVAGLEKQGITSCVIRQRDDVAARARRRAQQGPAG